MMNTGQDIEKTVREAFSHFEAPVPEEAWRNIAQRLPSTQAPVSGSVSKVKWYAAAGVAATVALVGYLYFNSGLNGNVEPKTKPSSALQQPEQSSIAQPIVSEPVQQRQDALPAKSHATEKSETVVQLNTPSNEIFTARDETPPLPDQTVTEDVVATSQHPRHEEQTVSAFIPENNPQQTDAVEEPAASTEETENNAAVNAPAYNITYTDIITPNNDNKNDIFILFTENIVSIDVTITNMGGKVMHRWNALHGFWDGRTETGQPAPAGTYFYNIFAITNTGQPVVRKGSLQLIR